jgi:hypothetical protein
LKNQLVERLEEALGGGEGAGDVEEELEDIPDVEVSAADKAKLAALDKKEPAVAATKTDAPKKELPKPKKSDDERKKELAAEKKKADEAFVADLKRRKERAEKFGLPFAMNDQERTRVRNAGAAKDFGLADAAPEAKKENKPLQKSAEQLKKEKEAFDAKLKARAERFGDALKPLPKATPIYDSAKRPGDALVGNAPKKTA